MENTGSRIKEAVLLDKVIFDLKNAKQKAVKMASGPKNRENTPNPGNNIPKQAAMKPPNPMRRGHLNVRSGRNTTVSESGTSIVTGPVCFGLDRGKDHPAGNSLRRLKAINDIASRPDAEKT
jgi:hypothetical protein